MGWPAKLPRADAQSTMISSIDLAKTVGEADFMQVNVQDAGSQLSWLLELVEEGETVIIARHGEPVAELVPARRKAGFPFGIAREEPLVAPGDDWWQPMSDAEAEDWIGGR